MTRESAKTQGKQRISDIPAVPPGITPGSEYQIFKPFYTTQPGATGLGLANVRRVIEIHGGGIQVANMEHGGALFILKLPRIQAQQAA